MKFVKPFAVVIALVIIAACTKYTDVPSKIETTSDTTLVGTWQWVRTDGGIADNIHDTPAATGKQLELQLSGDGVYAVFTNGTLTSQGTYNLEKRTCIHDRATKTYLVFSADPGLMVEEINKTNLLVSDENADGVDHLYKRLQTGSN